MAWQFDMKGRCVHISRGEEGYQDRLSPKDVGLRRLRCEVAFGGMVWVTLHDHIEQSVQEWVGSALDCILEPIEAEPLEIFHYHKSVIPLELQAVARHEQRVLSRLRPLP